MAQGISLTVRLLKGKYGICRLDCNAIIPEWINRGEFLSITRTSDELSVVCPEECIPDNIKSEKDWRILKIEGPLDFSLTGILAGISTILSGRKISIFAVSTFDTDYILVKDSYIDCAIEALESKGYRIIKGR